MIYYYDNEINQTAMKKNILKRSLFALWLLCGMSSPSFATLHLSKLQCEALTCPLAIDNTAPHFSWQLQSDKAGGGQTAYQILAASTEELLTEGKADLWDSGKVVSDQSIWITYQGAPLSSKSLVYWKVRVWDEEGKATPWSETACFGIGLLQEKDWEAKFIAADNKEAVPKSPLFRKRFQWNGGGERALLHVNSLGYHEVYLNGRPVSDAVLMPAVSEYKKRSLIVTYDVTPLLQAGTNDLVIWMGKGWYIDGLPGVTEGGPFVRAQMEAYKNGKCRTLLKSDATWSTRESGYVSTWVKGNLGGEEVDARMLLTDLSAASLDKATWERAVEAAVPEHSATPQMVEENRIRKEMHPLSMRQLNDSTWMFDMDTCFTGWTKVKFPRLERGQTVRLNYCDYLSPSGEFMRNPCYDLYTASGEADETFTNKFNYHAYRYLKITNLTEPPALEDITACLIHVDYGGTSSFSCSDKDMNAIHDMVQYTLDCLAIGGDLVDCPHIERLGYGGDGNASTLTMQLMRDLSPLYMNWMQAWGDCMQENGYIPYTAPNPNPEAGGGAYWSAFLITASWQTYLNYGDKRLLERYYPQMRRWLAFVEQYMPSGLLEPWPAPWYLGDWATPAGVNQVDSLSVDLVNNCVIAVCYDTMAGIAKVLDRPQDEAQSYREKAARLKRHIHQTFYDPNKKRYVEGTQTEMVYPMLAGATPQEEVPTVLESLKGITADRYRGQLFTGLVGVPVITEWAVKNREAEFMYSMLKKREQPGYLYMIDQGATTTWEHWNGRRSHLHNCFNGIGSWFYQALGGILPDEADPGYRHVLIQPQRVNDIKWVKAAKETPYGELKVEWEKDETAFMMNVHIPTGSHATVTLPVKAASVEVNGVEADHTDEIEIASGDYQINCQLPQND